MSEQLQGSGLLPGPFRSTAPRGPSLPVSELRFSLTPPERQPLHVQMEQALRDLIHTGELPPGCLLPGELDIARHFHVSRHTVRHALSALVAEGLLRRERGVGTTVVPANRPPVIERSLGHFYAFAWELRQIGLQHRSDILEDRAVQPDKDLAHRLQLAAGERVRRIRRLRRAGDEPLVLETAYIPVTLGRGITEDMLREGAIYDVLRTLHGVSVTSAREIIRPVVLRRAEARLLDVPSGSPAYSIERLSYAGTRPFEWQVSLARGDRYLYSIDLQHAEDGEESLSAPLP